MRKPSLSSNRLLTSFRYFLFVSIIAVDVCFLLFILDSSVAEIDLIEVAACS